MFSVAFAALRGLNNDASIRGYVQEAICINQGTPSSRPEPRAARRRWRGTFFFCLGRNKKGGSLDLRPPFGRASLGDGDELIISSQVISEMRLHGARGNLRGDRYCPTMRAIYAL